MDDAGDATIAVAKLREAINSGNKPDLYLNSGPSSVAAAVLPILAQNKILSLSVARTTDSTDPAKFPLNFDFAAKASDAARGISQCAKNKFHFQKAIARFLAVSSARAVVLRHSIFRSAVHDQAVGARGLPQ